MRVVPTMATCNSHRDGAKSWNDVVGSVPGLPPNSWETGRIVCAALRYAVPRDLARLNIRVAGAGGAEIEIVPEKRGGVLNLLRGNA